MVISPTPNWQDREQVYPEDLVLGELYIERNPYHPEYEYNESYYAGTTENNWGEVAYVFSEEPLPDGYDGDTRYLPRGGSMYTADELYSAFECIRSRLRENTRIQPLTAKPHHGAKLGSTSFRFHSERTMLSLIAASTS